jgi:hypothetical protein
VDLMVNTIGGRARVLRNVVPRRGHWLTIRVVDGDKRREAFGAEVRVRGEGQEWVRTVQPAESYLSSSSPWIHFGLGEVAQVEKVTVRWPDSKPTVEEFTVSGVDRLIVLQRGQGRVIEE